MCAWVLECVCVCMMISLLEYFNGNGLYIHCTMFRDVSFKCDCDYLQIMLQIK